MIARTRFGALVLVWTLCEMISIDLGSLVLLVSSIISFRDYDGSYVLQVFNNRCRSLGQEVLQKE